MKGHSLTHRGQYVAFASRNLEFRNVTLGLIELLDAQTVILTDCISYSGISQVLSTKSSNSYLRYLVGDARIVESITFGPLGSLVTQLGVMRACSEVFDTLNTVLEDALVTVRKCACMTQFDKLIDQGETKRHLIALRENLFKRCREVFYSPLTLGRMPLLVSL